MGRRALGLAILVIAGIGSCADVAGISDFSDCTHGNCSGQSTGSSSDSPSGPPPADVSTVGDQGISPMLDVTVIQQEGSDGDANTADTTVPMMDSTVPDGVGDERPPDATKDMTAPDIVVQDVVMMPDIGMPEAALPGPECWGADGGPSPCSAGQTCCVNAMTNAARCATGSSCSSGEFVVSCVGTTGNFPSASLCGSSKVCCGTLMLNGSGIAPVCNATELTSSCQSTCNDFPPGSCAAGTFTVRVCGAKADCSSDGLNNNCCRFGGSPLYWCVGSTVGSAACLN